MSLIQGASWAGSQKLATRQQLISTSAGLYDDLKDFNFSTIQTSTLTVPQWISTSALYVSDIQGFQIDISGIIINKDGVFNAPVVSLSSMSFKGFDSLLDLDVSFDLGLGNAIGGIAAGLGALVGGGLIAVGTGAGLAIQGAEQGIATMVAGRPQNFISQTSYETINFTTQLQISTLGNAYPLYSTIFRTVSSVSADSVPGREIFTSTFISPGSLCIRSVSDPFNLISADSNMNTSTIQSFGQWTIVPQDPSVVGDDITARNATFSTLNLVTDNTVPGSLNAFSSEVKAQTYSNFIPNTLPVNPPLQQMTTNSNLFQTNQTFFSNVNTYISTPFAQFTSSITTLPGGFYQVPSSLVSSLSLFSWDNPSTDGNFILSYDSLGNVWPSTGLIDIRTNPNQSTLLQYGYLVNTYIPQGSTVRLQFDYNTSVSSIVTAPVPLSTIVASQQEMVWGFETNPYELQLKIYNQGTGLAATDPGAFQIQASTFVIGASPTSSAFNQPGYAFQFNGNTFVNGTLEAQTIIALSSIFATSSFVDTQVSTASIIADVAEFTEMYSLEANVSTIKAISNYTNNYITTASRVRMAGFQTPLSIVTGNGSNFYDQNYRFDFVTDTFPQAMYLESQPANTTLMEITSTNIMIPNLNVTNLTASNLIYGKAEAPAIETSTINFGWTGNFDFPVSPQFSLQQSLVTPPGLFWTNYQTASANQPLNIMNFSNTVNMFAQQFSTPLTSVNTSFGPSNIQGWASTIFTNADTATKRVNLVQSAGKGELSLQAGQGNIAVSLNTISGLGGVPVPIFTGSTYKFTCDGTTWTTLSNAPTPGTIQYTNGFQMTMDFETLNISTTDTLNLNAEKINLNGIVTIPDANFDSITLPSQPPSGYALNILRDYTGSFNAQGTANLIQITNTINSTDFTNPKPTVNPNRGANLFNSYNVTEWNNSMYGIDTNAGSGRPLLICGDVIIKSPAFTPYAGQFFLNNILDSPSSNIPIYVNVEGFLSTIGFAGASQYTRVFTADGTNWNIQSNIPNPQGLGGYTFSNYYNLQMNGTVTQLDIGQPLVESMPSKTTTTAKIIMDCPQIRVYTMESASFPSKESGFEYSTYFDENVVFTGSQSDAVNPIVNQLGNYYYSVTGWSAQVWFSRMRTESLGIQGFDIDAIVQLVSGTPGDFIWASARYINVNGPAGSVSANIRENYFMTPKNYHTSFFWNGQQ